MSDPANANNESFKPKPIFDSHDGSTATVASATSSQDPLQEETPEDLSYEDIGSDDPHIVLHDDHDDHDDHGHGEASENKTRIMLIVAGLGLFILIFGILVTVLLKTLGKGSSKPVTLEYWGLWEDPQVMQVAINQYKKKEPHVTIQYVKQEKTSYRDKLLSRGKEGRGPDIFRFHNTWLPEITEVIAPIPESIMSSSEFEKTFYKVAQDDLKIGSSYHGLPRMIDGLVLVYNKELFSNIGVSTPPKTWEDVIRIANQLKVVDASGNILTSGISLGSAKNIEHFSDILGWMLLQNGANLSSLSSTQGVEVLQNYRLFSEPPLSYWSSTMPNNIQAFTSGKVGMIIVPSWQILEIQAGNKDLKIGVAPLPILPGGEQLSLATYWVEGVSKTSKNQLEAWKFLKFLTEKDTMTLLYKEQVKTKIFGEPYSRVDLRDTIIQNEYIGAVVAQAPFMKSMPIISRTFDNGLNDAVVSYIKDAVNATESGVSYEQAFQTASSGVAEVLKQYNIQ